MYGADQHLERALIVPGLCSIAMRLRESLCRIIPNLSMQAGIYIGNGQMIEAQRTGTNIMISAVRAQGYARYW